MAVVLFAAGGCALLKPAKSECHYYVLTPLSAASVSRPAAKRESRRAVCLRPVEVASYLQNNGMAVCPGTNEVHYALFHCWAEPLGTGIRRVLGEDLRHSRQIGAVITDQPAPAHDRLYTIWIRVLKCEGLETGHQGSAVFEATWEIAGPGPEQKTLAQGVFQAKPAAWKPGDYNELAHRLSGEIADFSEVLVQAVSRRVKHHALNENGPAPR